MRTYANGATFDDYEKARKLVHWGVDAIAGALAAERNTDDALLASVMRKLLKHDDSFLAVNGHDNSFTIDDTTVAVSVDEMGALHREWGFD